MNIAINICIGNANPRFTSHSIGYCKACDITIGKGNCISINKSFGLGLYNGRNTVTSFTLYTFCKNSSIYTVNIPFAILNSNNRSVTISTLFTLDTLNTLLTLCTICSISNSKGSGFTVCKCNCIGINEAFCICFCDR